MKTTTFILLLALAFTAAQAAPPAEGFPLRGMHVIGTPDGFLCDGHQRSIAWTNGDDPIYIRKANLWIGAVKGITEADISVIAFTDPKNLIAQLGIDRYAQPTGTVETQQDFAPDYITVVPGGRIVLKYMCRAPATPQLTAGTRLVIWYFKTTP